jgi:hypothetical protein
MITGGLSVVKDIYIGGTGTFTNLTTNLLNNTNIPYAESVNKIGSSFTKLQGTLNMADVFTDMCISNKGRYMLITSTTGFYVSSNNGTSFTTKSTGSVVYSTCKIRIRNIYDSLLHWNK